MSRVVSSSRRVCLRHEGSIEKLFIDEKRRVTAVDSSTAAGGPLISPARRKYRDSSQRYRVSLPSIVSAEVWTTVLFRFADGEILPAHGDRDPRSFYVPGVAWFLDFFQVEHLP